MGRLPVGIPGNTLSSAAPMPSYGAPNPHQSQAAANNV